MAVLIIACNVFRPELELLASEGMHVPEAVYLEAELHNVPDKLRASVQEIIDDFEAKHPEPSDILFGYGLCGRGMCNVTASHATLVFPRVHDCISLLIGQAHDKDHALKREGAIYWTSPGQLESFQISLHLEYEARLAKYAERCGEAKAKRMLRAEQAMFKNYHHVGHILWPEMAGRYDETARRVADAVGIPYQVYPGSSAFMRDLILGNHDAKRFLRLQPGQSIDMDVDGSIIAVP